jgi:hypothetical protein
MSEDRQQLSRRVSRQRNSMIVVIFVALAAIVIAMAGIAVAAGSPRATAAAKVKPPKPPPAAQNKVTITSTPVAVTFGGASTVTGQVSGPGNGGVKVTLEQSPYPYTGGFKPTGSTTTTTATGGFSLAVTPSVSSHYVVAVKTKPAVTSPQTAVAVRVKVSLGLSTMTPRRGQRVRFSGTVSPAHNGKTAQIQKRTSTGAWKTVASATLVTAAPVNGVALSQYSKQLRTSRTATYRVQVNPADGDHATGTSSTRRVRVH